MLSLAAFERGAKRFVKQWNALHGIRANDSCSTSGVQGCKSEHDELHIGENAAGALRNDGRGMSAASPVARHGECQTGEETLGFGGCREADGERLGTRALCREEGRAEGSLTKQHSLQQQQQLVSEGDEEESMMASCQWVEAEELTSYNGGFIWMQIKQPNCELQALLQDNALPGNSAAATTTTSKGGASTPGQPDTNFPQSSDVEEHLMTADVAQCHLSMGPPDRDEAANGAGFVAEESEAADDAASGVVFGIAQDQIVHDDASSEPPKMLPVLTWDFHATFSHSFGVPVLFFRCSMQDGRVLPPAATIALLPAGSREIASENEWTFITQMDHPALLRPWLCLHPCGTQSCLHPLLAAAAGLRNDSLLSGDGDGKMGFNEVGVGLQGVKSHEEWSRSEDKDPSVLIWSWLSIVGPLVGLPLPRRDKFLKR